MKQGLHPTWQHDMVVTCSCGNTFTTGGAKAAMQVDICSACHPFFTGEMKFVDRQGRVDKFLKQRQAAEAKKAAAQAQVQAKQAKKQTKKTVEAKSYKQILQEQQQELKAVQAAAAKAGSDGAVANN